MLLLRHTLFILALLGCGTRVLLGQERGEVRVEVFGGHHAIAAAEVITTTTTTRTDEFGLATLQLRPGSHQLTILAHDWLPTTVSLDVRPGQTQTVRIDLVAAPALESDPFIFWFLLAPLLTICFAQPILFSFSPPRTGKKI